MNRIKERKRKSFVKIMTIGICLTVILIGCAPKSSAALTESLLPSEKAGVSYLSGNVSEKAKTQQYYYDQLKDFINVPFFEFNNIEKYVKYMAAHPEEKIKKVLIYVNAGLDRSFYSEIKKISDFKSTSVLVNKYNALPKGYVPDGLTNIPMQYADWEHLATKETVDAFVVLAEKAATEGIFLKATSAYRSYESQKYGYDNAIASGRTVEDVDTLNARPGHSEHQTGLTIDVNNTDYRNWVEGGVYYEYGKWLKENSYKYGFIIRYPEGKEEITGYHHEAWHLRYLGKTEKGSFLSVDVYESGLTYDEYYAEYIEKHTVMYLVDEQKMNILNQGY